MEVNRGAAVAMIFSSVMLWCFAVLLSTKLAGTEIQRPGQTGHSQDSQAANRGRMQSAEGDDTVVVSPESAKLREEVERNPADKQKLLLLAASLQRDAKVRPSPGLVMEAVRSYSRVLDLNKEDPDALLGLATLCFEADIIDKAVEYYERYLKQFPADPQVSTDYALALIQAQRPERAIEVLTPLAEKHPDRFQMQLTLAVAEKFRGNREKALENANRALAIATGDDAKSHIQNFIASLKKDGELSSSTEAVPASAAISPAAVVEQYFTRHPIIGPKLKRITWPDAATVKVAVENFPVEQMPPFARDKFLQSSTAALGVIPEAIRVELVDFQSEKVLLSFAAGKSE